MEELTSNDRPVTTVAIHENYSLVWYNARESHSNKPNVRVCLMRGTDFVAHIAESIYAIDPQTMVLAMPHVMHTLLADLRRQEDLAKLANAPATRACPFCGATLADTDTAVNEHYDTEHKEEAL